MKILVVGNYQPDAQQSMQRFAALMCDQLRMRGHSVELLFPRPIVNRQAAAPSGCAKWLGYIDKFVLFPYLLRQAALRAEVVHICDHSNAPYAFVLKHIPHLVTCHDVLAIRSAQGQVSQNPTGRSGRILQKFIVWGLNRARRIVCDSTNTQVELLSVSSVKEARTRVVPISLNFPYRQLAPPEIQRVLASHDLRLAEISTSEPGFILHVGGNHWYKNRLGVVRIYRHLQRTMSKDHAPLLVMAGQELTAEIHNYIRDHDLERCILNIQNCSNEVLQALYSSARLLLFPSLAEGFGWPIIEAQACGCRVVTSNRPPMTEVGAASVTYICPDDEESAAGCVSDLLQESPSQKLLRADAGFCNAARFSTERMMQSYLEIYEELTRAGKSGV